MADFAYDSADRLREMRTKEREACMILGDSDVYPRPEG